LKTHHHVIHSTLFVNWALPFLWGSCFKNTIVRAAED
jgi:hypothetical protein